MIPFPTGTVTFLFTDIAGSTALWEQHPDAMRLACARHDAIIAAEVTGHNGVLVRPRGEGDSRFAVFPFASDALTAACSLQLALRAEPWPEPVALPVRMALHTGEADLREGDYYGSAVNRCARLRSLAHGGQVLLSLATQELVREMLPEGVTLKDLGAHRLKDLTHPERVFQLGHPDLPGEFPPLQSLSALPNNLPLQLTSFIGREPELAETKDLLAKTRLLTLMGSGGAGKSRLSLQVAAEVLEEYPEGAWLVELAAISDPALVASAVAGALGVVEQASQPLMAQLTGYLKPRKVLLVLDNCEHLLDACAQVTEGLLKACPELRILTSSREGLGIAGETKYRVPSLAAPDPSHLPPMESLAQYDAVRLFVERAQSAQPAFRMTETNAGPVVQVCRRLDGIPLALELAAARVKVLPVEGIAGRLDDMFRLLTGGSRTALPRQQTLRALIDWSYNLLSEMERALLRRLSVFTGGWTLEGAEQVCSGAGIEEGEVLDLLTSLIEKSLVVVEEVERGTRYRLLETIRQYARERLLESGEGEALREGHLEYYLGLAEEGEQRCKGPEQPEWLDRLEADHDNLRAALAWAREGKDRIRFARLAGALGHFWRVRGYFREGSDWLRGAIEASPDRPPQVRAHTLETAGHLIQISIEHFNQADAYLMEAEELYRELGDVGGRARCRAARSNVIGWLGDRERAEAMCAEGLALARGWPDPYSLALVLRGAPWTTPLTGVARIALAREGLTVNRALGQPEGIAVTTMNLASILGEWDKDESQSPPWEIQALYTEATELARSINDKHCTARGLQHMATVTELGRADPKRTVWLEESLALLQEMNHGDQEEVLYDLAQAYIVCKEADRAYDVLKRYAFGSSVLLPVRRVQNLALLRMLARRRGDDAAARASEEEMFRRVREAPAPEGAYWLACAGYVSRALGEYAAARSFYDESLRLRPSGDLQQMAWSLEDYGVLAAMAGQYERAARLLGAAGIQAERLGRALPISEADDFHRAVRLSRAVLGEEAFEAAWAEGQDMTLEEAVAYALQEPEGGDA